MKFLATADLHIRKEKPRFRKDNYFKTALSKLEWVVNTANDLNAIILIAGDIFDTSKATVEVVNRVVEVLSEAKQGIIAVEGQHDLKFHTNIKDTPIHNLYLSQVINNVKDHPVHTVGWGEKIEPKEGHSVLLVHKCITPDEPPFFLQDAESADSLLKKYHQYYSFIVTGDYHVPFIKKHKDCTLINCGTLMRNTKDMLDYQAYVYSFSSNLPKVKQIEVPMKPASEVFDLDAIDKSKEHGIALDTSRLQELMKSSKEEIDLDSIVWMYHKQYENVVSKTLVEEILNNV
jgi:DNA repair exonuclease SbcCD nuclease subunit